uniref:Uncharacterized protein n=1 Tax=Strongyloides papillosus TaxID=174720 RepID=A0A0N5CIP1_STREA
MSFLREKITIWRQYPTLPSTNNINDLESHQPQQMMLWMTTPHSSTLIQSFVHDPDVDETYILTTLYTYRVTDTIPTLMKDRHPTTLQIYKVTDTSDTLLQPYMNESQLFDYIVIKTTLSTLRPELPTTLLHLLSIQHLGLASAPPRARERELLKILQENSTVITKGEEEGRNYS